MTSGANEAHSSGGLFQIVAKLREHGLRDVRNDWSAGPFVEGKRERTPERHSVKTFALGIVSAVCFDQLTRCFNRRIAQEFRQCVAREVFITMRKTHKAARPQRIVIAGKLTRPLQSLCVVRLEAAKLIMRIDQPRRKNQRS